MYTFLHSSWRRQQLSFPYFKSTIRPLEKWLRLLVIVASMILNMKLLSIYALYYLLKENRQGIYLDENDARTLAKKREVIKAWRIDGYKRFLKKSNFWYEHDRIEAQFGEIGWKALLKAFKTAKMIREVEFDFTRWVFSCFIKEILGSENHGIFK